MACLIIIWEKPCFYSDFEKKTGYKICLFEFQNEWQSIVLDKLYQIMFKLIILSQIRAIRHQNLTIEILLLSPFWSTVHCMYVFLKRKGLTANKKTLTK